jgi:hypothetical protein
VAASVHAATPDEAVTSGPAAPYTTPVDVNSGGGPHDQSMESDQSGASVGVAVKALDGAITFYENDSLFNAVIGPGAVGAGAARASPASTCCRDPDSNQTPQPKPGASTMSNQTRRTPESSRLTAPSFS